MAKYQSKYKKRKLRKYEDAGMYSANTITAAGQGTAGSSESIVYDEANPQVLEAAKNAKLQNDETLSKNAETAIQDINTQKANDEAAIEENAMKAKATNQQVDATVGKGIKTLTNDGKSADVLKNVGTKVKDGVATVKETAINVADKTKEFLKSKATKAAEAAAKKKLQEETTKKLAAEAAKKQAALMAKEKVGEVVIDKTKDAVIDKTKDLVVDKTKDLVIDKTKEAITKKATDKLVETGTKKLVEKGTEKLVEEGTKKLVETGVKEGAKSAVGSSINPNPYATAANLAGTAISMGSDDGDATTWNAGEASGDILAKAGSYAGYGAMIGSAVPVIGNAVGAVGGAIIGAGVATWQGLANRNKARKEKKAAELKAQQKTDEQNTKTTKNFMGQMSRVRAEELKAKTYSGYDLGNNVNQRRGGFKPLPAYN